MTDETPTQPPAAGTPDPAPVPDPPAVAPAPGVREAASAPDPAPEGPAPDVPVAVRAVSEAPPQADVPPVASALDKPLAAHALEAPAVQPVPDVPFAAGAPEMPYAATVPGLPAADVPVAYGIPQAPAVRPRRRLALGLAVALVVVLVGGGVGYAALRNGGGDDAKPSATPWAAPTPTATKAFGAKSGGSHYGSLSLMLLPVPSGYMPGPDVHQYGNDTVLDTKQATDVMEGDVSDLSKKERKELTAEITAMHIEGAGLRTYSRTDGELIVQMELVQMRNKEAARAETEFFGSLKKFLDDGGKAPKVKNYPHAVCVVMPKDLAVTTDLDSMTCQATEGDIVVTMTANGPSPMDRDEAAGLLSKQLDRIKDPGEAV
ncbi:hypothetical protein OG552_20125 [Streptomyces sp. NBC_01476]|uniref:hypothetical protein n=1 Tax=Streptomyces sp. NBC_01476 TaxID=2903881 RepID=UPI002E356E75|nr:hypothetical protein [Streptomyces sp. NBC_01476]